MSYFICRKLCEPTLFSARCSPAIWTSLTEVGETDTHYRIYTASVVKTGFIASSGWFVKTSHCGTVGFQHKFQQDDGADFTEPLPLSSFRLTMNQYRQSSGLWVRTSVTKTGDFSEQGMDGDFLWAIQQPSNYYKPISFDYASYIGTNLTLPSELLEGSRLSGPDAHFKIVSALGTEQLHAGNGIQYGSMFVMEYV